MSKINSSLDMNDTMPFGKYKSQKVADIMKSNFEYLLWMRETKKTEDDRFFSKEVHQILNDRLANAPKGGKTRAAYKPWDLSGLDDSKGEAVDVVLNELTKSDSSAKDTLAYSESWGMFG